MAELKHQPKWWQRSAQAVASSRYGSRLASRLLPSIDRTVLRLSSNRFTLSSAPARTGGRIPIMVLTPQGG